MELLKFVFDWPWKYYSGRGWNEILFDIATIPDVPPPSHDLAINCNTFTN
jgi:hypothetical protein